MRSPLKDRLLSVVLAVLAAGLFVTVAESASWWRVDRGGGGIGIGLASVEMCSDHGCHEVSYEQLGGGDEVPLRFLLTRLALFASAALALVLAAVTLLGAVRAREHLGRIYLVCALVALALGWWSIDYLKGEGAGRFGEMGWAFFGAVVAGFVGAASSYLGGRVLRQRHVERELDLPR